MVSKPDPRLAELAGFNTNPEWNGKIVDRLMGCGEIMHTYAAKRILELEAEVATLREDHDDGCACRRCNDALVGPCWFDDNERGESSDV